jgi:hypothetical protein
MITRRIGISAEETMSVERLNDLLAERIMGWRVAPGRFMMGGRGWKPTWRFQPTNRLEDAFHLLDAANPSEYCITARQGGLFTVRVQMGGAVGEASDNVKARAITYAVARAIGIDPIAQPMQTKADSR